MSASRNHVVLLAVLVAFAMVLGAGAMTSSTASAAGVNIDPSSCGGAGYPNCTGLPANVTIGANSCTVAASCGNLRDGVAIGANSCNGDEACLAASGSIGQSSCDGDSACYASGADGTGSIGDNSCNGRSACYVNGTEGSGSVGDSSCNDDSACYANGHLGSGSVGNHSCNGHLACDGNGYAGPAPSGTGSVGDSSCNGDSACRYNGYAGDGSVGDNSCNYANACYDNGDAGTGSVGDNSCTQSGAYDNNCQGLHASVGNCQYNDVTPDECKTVTTTTLGSSLNPSVVGQSVTFTATVSPTPDGGTVAFKDGGTLIAGCSAQPLTTAQATCATSALTAESHVITAEYSGTDNYGGSTGTLSPDQVVDHIATTTTVASSLNPSVVGQSVTFTATVSPTPDGGTVAFKDGGTLIAGCSAQPLTTAQATCATSALTVGSHVITAEYSGTDNYGGSTGTLSQDELVVAATIQVEKVVVGDSSARFNLEIDGVVQAYHVGDGAVTKPVAVDPGSHYVGESAVSPARLSDYDQRVTCEAYNAIVGSQPHSIASRTRGTTLFNVSAGDVVTCTITNTKLTSIWWHKTR